MNEPTQSPEVANPDGPTAKLVNSLLEAGYSQGFLARKLGVPRSRITRWSRGENTSRTDDALRLRDMAAKLKARAKHAAEQQAA